MSINLDGLFFFSSSSPQKAGMATVSFGLFEEQMSDKSINTNTGSGERISWMYWR